MVKRTSIINIYFQVYTFCFIFSKIFIDIDTYDISRYTIATQYLSDLHISEAEYLVFYLFYTDTGYHTEIIQMYNSAT